MATKTEIENVLNQLADLNYKRSVEKHGELGTVYLATRISGEVGEYCKELQRLQQATNRDSKRYLELKEANPDANDFELDSMYQNKTVEDAIVELTDVVTMCLISAKRLGCNNFGKILIDKFNEVSNKWESPIQII
jgi:hypothetical protein